jgi:hypothetical protein
LGGVGKLAEDGRWDGGLEDAEDGGRGEEGSDGCADAFQAREDGRVGGERGYTCDGGTREVSAIARVLRAS